MENIVILIVGMDLALCSFTVSIDYKQIIVYFFTQQYFLLLSLLLCNSICIALISGIRLSTHLIKHILLIGLHFLISWDGLRTFALNSFYIAPPPSIFL